MPHRSNGRPRRSRGVKSWKGKSRYRSSNETRVDNEHLDALLKIRVRRLKEQLEALEEYDRGFKHAHHLFTRYHPSFNYLSYNGIYFDGTSFYKNNKGMDYITHEEAKQELRDDLKNLAVDKADKLKAQLVALETRDQGFKYAHHLFTLYHPTFDCLSYNGIYFDGTLFYKNIKGYIVDYISHEQVKQELRGDLEKLEAAKSIGGEDAIFPFEP